MGSISVAVTRGKIVESRHSVHAVLVRGDAVAEAWGDAGLVAYVRSALKPVQALPLVPYGLPSEELAVCASRGIEVIYLDTVLDSSTRLLERYRRAAESETS